MIDVFPIGNLSRQKTEIMKKIKLIPHIIFVVGIIIFLTSCDIIYMDVPNELNMPLAGNKGEFKGAAYYGNVNDAAPVGLIGVQVSYAIDSHFVVLVNSQNSLPNDTIRHFLEEIGCGYFKKIGKHDRGRFELLSGIGYGETHAKAAADNYLNATFSQIFVQPDIGIVGRSAEIGIGTRIRLLDANGSYMHDGDNYTAVNYMAAFFDPSLMVSFGSEYVKLHGAIGKSLFIGGNQQLFNVHQDTFIYFGLTLNLGRKYKERK